MIVSPGSLTGETRAEKVPETLVAGTRLQTFAAAQRTDDVHPGSADVPCVIEVSRCLKPILATRVAAAAAAPARIRKPMTDEHPDIQPDPIYDAAILAQALPYMQRYEGKTVVVKYGGHAMGDAGARQGLRPRHRPA